MLRHEHLFLSIAGNEKIHKNLSTSRTCNLQSWIYTKQVDVFTEFLTNFIKPEVLFECNRIRKLKTVDFSSTENHLLNNLLSVVSIACKIKKKQDQVQIFKRSNNCLFKMCCLYGWKITADQWFFQKRSLQLILLPF